MLEKSFIFESSYFNHDDLCDRIEITIAIDGTSCGDCSWEFVSMTNTDDENIERPNLLISQFPKDEQKIIQLRADTIAQKYAEEAFGARMDAHDEHQFESYREDQLFKD